MADNRPRTVARRSGNAKVGKTTATTARTRASCPRDCDVWDECYGANVSRSGATIFANVETAPNDGDLSAYVSRPSTRAVRFGVVGDYLRPAPGDDRPDAPGTIVDAEYISETNRAADLAHARGIPVWSYSHAWEPHPDRENIDPGMFRYTVRASTASWDGARRARAAGWAPAVVTDPGDPMLGTIVDGARVVVCPAQVRDGVTCDTCGLCARPAVTVAFLRHGAASARLRRTRETAPEIGPDGRIAYR